MDKHQGYLSNLVAIIRLNLFVKEELQKWLDHPFQDHSTPHGKIVQGDPILKKDKKQAQDQ
jgi:hypothetical protein